MRDQSEASTVRLDLVGTAAGDWRPPEDLVGELAEAFLERHRRGERPSVEEYAGALPELAGEPRRSNSTRRRWRCARPSWAPTTPTRSAA